MNVRWVGALGLALGSAAGLWIFRESGEPEIEPPSPALDPKSELPPASAARQAAERPSPEDAEQLLARFLCDYQRRTREIGDMFWDGRESRFGNEKYFLFVEARLFCAAAPLQSESFARRLALDPTGTPHERRLGLFMLGALIEAAVSRSAAEVLKDVIRANEDRVSKFALVELAKADYSGEFRGLYRELAAAGDAYAVELLSRWSDPLSEAIVRRWVFGEGSKRGEIPNLYWATDLALDRFKLLSSPDWENALRDILLKNDTFAIWNWDGEWALRVALDRKLAGLDDILKARVYAEIAGSASIAALFESKMRKPMSWSEVFVSGKLGGVRDLRIDDVLIARARLGSALSEVERARLRHFGYCDDPWARLKELLP